MEAFSGMARDRLPCQDNPGEKAAEKEKTAIAFEGQGEAWGAWQVCERHKIRENVLSDLKKREKMGYTIDKEQRGCYQWAVYMSLESV